jgi:hypothetical protein
MSLCDTLDTVSTASDTGTGGTVGTSGKDVKDVKEIQLENKEKMYYKTVNKFFKSLSRDDFEKMVRIIDGDAKISLRLLDWFVTNYSDKTKICYEYNDERFNVHMSYKAQLKSYKKRYFDPFRRYKKFKYTYNEPDVPEDTQVTVSVMDKPIQICTTIGQLNFFSWAFSNGVIQFVENNYNTIINAMIKSNKDVKKKKLDKKNQNKKEKKKAVVKKEGVRVEAIQKIIDDNYKIVISFD